MERNDSFSWQWSIWNHAGDKSVSEQFESADSLPINSNCHCDGQTDREREEALVYSCLSLPSCSGFHTSFWEEGKWEEKEDDSE